MFKPHPKQVEFFESKEKYIFYSGGLPSRGYYNNTMNIFNKILKPEASEPDEDTKIANQSTETKVVSGKIIKLGATGWGFITSREIPFTRIFFHWTSLNQDTKNFTDLQIGMKVNFTPVQIKDKGTRAIKISVIE